ncbi:hypothetical protein [Lysobacter enzymogenes]|uniref:hypothetical protein n=1 Tax=Lysobacter enzymogenes TaxID=69 RepID=UPI00089669AC|nr:hypothetical protein [Lysobacter enzymogenes]SDX24288.1 hypothetical protein SAMN05421681_104340 [Lysobacter enzymogenes]
MHLSSDVRPVDSFFQKTGNALPASPGVYAFWWIATKSELMSANRHIVLKGPRGQAVDVEYRDWWPNELAYPCLYVGKTTNIKKRFALHIKRKCPGRLHPPSSDNRKAKPRTSSCQLRFGIEHIFPRELDPLSVIMRNVGFSYTTEFLDNAVAERFFTEDRLVGCWRPWFNIDSER